MSDVELLPDRIEQVGHALTAAELAELLAVELWRAGLCSFNATRH